jgi:hypothetical protein
MGRVVIGRVTGSDGFFNWDVYDQIRSFKKTRHHASPDPGSRGIG